MSQDFVAFARACGLDITHVKDYDKILRVPTFNKPNKRNGALLLRQDGNGWCIAYDGGGELSWFSDPRGPRAWTEEEKNAWKRKQAEAQRERAAGWAQSALKAEAMLKTCRTGNHGYLMRKGFQDTAGLCLPDGALFVPMRHLTTNSLQGAQVIRWLPQERVFEKKFLFGMNPRLAVLRIGQNRPQRTILAEGYATGLSIKAACVQMHLEATVLVCFSDHNLVRVAQALENAPFDRCIIADHDDIPPREREKRDAGEDYEARGPGELAAVAAGLPYAMAPELGFDANDVHMKHGLLPLCGLVMKAIRGVT